MGWSTSHSSEELIHLFYLGINIIVRDMLIISQDILKTEERRAA